MLTERNALEIRLLMVTFPEDSGVLNSLENELTMEELAETYST